MEKGKVKRLKEKFGFLTMESGEDVFFVPMVLEKRGPKFEELHEGQAVEAEVEQGEKGLRASVVRVL